MINRMLKTLSFSFVTLVSAAMVSASDQAPVVDRSAAASDSARFGCATPSEIDLGWDEQIQLVEKRQAERDAEGLAVPGAIITPPFEVFAPYRRDVPPGVTAAGLNRTVKRHTSGGSSRD
jgi:hypothetical protein